MKKLLLLAGFPFLFSLSNAQKNAASHSLLRPSVLVTDSQAAAAPQSEPAQEETQNKEEKPKEQNAKEETPQVTPSKDVPLGFKEQFPSLEEFLNMQKQIWIDENAEALKNLPPIMTGTAATAKEQAKEEPVNPDLKEWEETITADEAVPVEKEAKEASPKTEPKPAPKAAKTKPAQSATAKKVKEETPPQQIKQDLPPGEQISPAPEKEPKKPGRVNWLRFSFGVLYLLILSAALYIVSKYQ